MVQQQQNVKCSRCEEICQGETVRVFDSYYHLYCFSCGVSGCAQDLMTDGYFSVEGEIYCRHDYHKMKGQKCAGCCKYVEGEVVSVLNTVYHTRCFGCVKCNVTFPPKAEIFYDGDGLYCEKCATNTNTSFDAPSSLHKLPSNNGNVATPDPYDVSTSECYGCKKEMNSSQVVIALNQPWHVACFKCHQCASLLTGDYMERDGQPYCERDYHENFGVTCDNCREFITGKVLQAGEKLYHPHCSTCALCRLTFQEGEEMFLQGEYIWHPECSEKLKADQEAKRQKRQGTIFLDFDSDGYLTDSTFPTTENYDASRSYNDLSDATLNDEVSLLSHPLSERSLESYRNLLQRHSKDNYKANSEQDIRNANLVSNLRTSSQRQNDSAPKGAVTGAEIRNRDRTKSCSSGSASGSAHSSPKNTPGCFRNVNHVLNGNTKRNGLRGSDRNNSNQYYSPRLDNKPRSKESPGPLRDVGLVSPSTTSDIPPPKPPPPTRESSKKWHHKTKSMKSNTAERKNSQKSRRDSFSKAITIGTDESSESTDSETNPSTVNTSSSNEEESLNELKKSYNNNLNKINKNIDFSTTKMKINGIDQNPNRMKLYEDKSKDIVKEALPTFKELGRSHFATSYA